MDLLYGYKYRDYLKRQEQAILTCNLINGIGAPKKTLNVYDLIGYWCDGIEMNKAEYYQYQREKARKYKQLKRKRGVVNHA